MKPLPSRQKKHRKEKKALVVVHRFTRLLPPLSFTHPPRSLVLRERPTMARASTSRTSSHASTPPFSSSNPPFYIRSLFARLLAFAITIRFGVEADSLEHHHRSGLEASSHLIGHSIGQDRTQ
mmetsp:Transcript_22136/g.48405  ORF Transcript_22136/g.48405 Transcript_22136/m.48405 type:complete len:123 (-) Transcript_22136:42-410(-)